MARRTCHRGATRTLSSGFTLVELMVALTGGLFVSVAVFMLAKQSTALYQAEARVSTATLGNIVGFERLRNDISRAGFMTTPNIRKDPKFCGTVSNAWPDYLERLQSIFIQRTPAGSLPVQLTGEGFTPDEIVMAGAYSSIDQFWTEGIRVSGTQFAIELKPTSPAMVRLGYDTAATQTVRDALLADVFGNGRIIRVVDTGGREQYSVIEGVTTVVADAPVILVKGSNPTLLFRETNQALACGIAGGGDRHYVNVVNLVKYSIRAVPTGTTFRGRYAPMLDPPSGMGPQTDVGRTELVREELNADGASIGGTEEIVSEFAVDLGLGVTVGEVVAGPDGGVSQLTTFLPGDTTNIPRWAGSLLGSDMDLSLRGPQLIRAVRARLAVRSRQGDRVSDLADGGGLPVPDGRFRIRLADGTFARIRTVQSDVAVRSQREDTWL